VFYKAQESGSLSPSWVAGPQEKKLCIKAEIDYNTNFRINSYFSIFKARSYKVENQLCNSEIF